MRRSKPISRAALCSILLGCALPLLAVPSPSTHPTTASGAAPAAAAPAAPAAPPQGDVGPRSTVPPELAKQAKVTLDAARTTALAKVPGGVVQSEELEKEHGKLVYSFDIKVAEKAGVEEVIVSAISGNVLGKHHETDKAEKAEKQLDAKRKPAPPPKASARP
jgi:hypothetical protein